MNTIKITTKANGTLVLALVTAAGNTITRATAKTEADLDAAIARLKSNAGMMADTATFFVW